MSTANRRIIGKLWFRLLLFASWLPLCTAVVGCSSSKPRVVLYSAQDPEFAEKIINEFTRQTGLDVVPRYDTEANKSVALYEELEREAGRPRCDVFWNNEILSTIRLQRQGLLEPYESPSSGPFPAANKAKDHTWTAFATRARVLIVNTKLVPAADRPRSLFDLTKPRWKGQVAMAKPEAGTTATQVACLFQVLGVARAKRFYTDLKANQMAIVSGNRDVAVGVSQGQFAIGMTDTDDAMGELEAGRPVAIIFPDSDRPKTDRMGTLFIPNTLAIIHGSRNPDGARRLVDYLLSPEVEKALAESASHQIPLNPNVRARLPKEMRTPEQIKAMAVDFDKAADLWGEAQAFVRKEFAGP